jgi:drug/metabolite transporter (DMT)-like permease
LPSADPRARHPVVRAAALPFELTSRAVRRMARWEGIVVLLTTLGCWSTVPLLLKHLAPYLDHWTNTGGRYGASALLWLPAVVWALVRGRLPRSIWVAAIVPAAANTAGQIAFTAAHSHIGPGLLTFGLRMQLVVVALGAYLLFPSERPTIRSPRYLVGIGLLMAGMAGILLDGGALDGGASTLGVVLSLAAGAGYAAYALAVRRFMSTYHPIIAFGVIALYTAGALLALMLAFGRNGGADVLQLESRELWALAVSAFFGIALGHVLYYTSIDRLGVATTTGVLQLQPFVVGGISLAVFGERMTGIQWGGGVVAVVGAALVLGAQKAAERARRARAA